MIEHTKKADGKRGDYIPGAYCTEESCDYQQLQWDLCEQTGELSECCPFHGCVVCLVNQLAAKVGPSQ